MISADHSFCEVLSVSLDDDSPDGCAVKLLGEVRVAITDRKATVLRKHGEEKEKEREREIEREIEIEYRSTGWLFNELERDTSMRDDGILDTRATQEIR